MTSKESKFLVQPTINCDLAAVYYQLAALVSKLKKVENLYCSRK